MAKISISSLPIGISMVEAKSKGVTGVFLEESGKKNCKIPQLFMAVSKMIFERHEHLIAAEPNIHPIVV